MSDKKKRALKVLNLLGKVFLGILILLLLVVLFVRSPWGQNIIKDKVINSIEKKTGGDIALERLFIKFNGDIQVDELLIKTPEGDTVLYAGSLSANIPIIPLIKGNSFGLDGLDVNKVKARIIRKDSMSGFNYEFLTNAYASDTTQAAPATDTTSAPMEINIGNIDLYDFDIVYKDDVSGIDAEVKFQKILLEFTKTDLQNMVFSAGDVILRDAMVNYVQTKPFPESNTEAPPMPVFEIDNIEISNLQGVYDTKPDSLYTGFLITKVNLEKSRLDLKDNMIASEFIGVSNSDITLKTKQSSVKQNDTTAASAPFEWPQWKIDLASIDFENNSFKYLVNDARVKKGTFDPNAVEIDSLIFKAESIIYEEALASAKIQKVHFQEGSGLDLNKFNVQARLTHEQMEFSDLDISVNNNRLSGDLNIAYENFSDFLNKPDNARLDLDLNNIYLRLSEIYRFQPDLKENKYVQALASSPIRGKVSANGKLNNINLQNLNLNWSKTRIVGNGSILNAQDPENLSFILPNVKVNSQRSDLIKFVKEEDLGVKLPETVSLSGSFSGNTSEINTNALLITSEGSLDVDGEFQVGDQIVFDAEVQGDSIALGNLLQNEALGEIKINLKTSGKGSSINDLNASLNSEISSFTYNGYEFRDININGELENGAGPLNIDYKDNNLNMNAESRIQLDSVSPRIDVHFVLEGANLEALGITRKEIKTGFTLDGWFEGNSTKYEMEASIIDGVAVYNNETYLLGSFDASAYVREDTTSVKIDNRMIDLDLQSNASPGDFANSLNRHLKRYISENYEEDSIAAPVNLKVNAKIRQAPILNEVFLVNLEDLDTIDVNIDFREKERELEATVSVPHVLYYGSEIDSLEVFMRSDTEDLNFDLAFNELNAGPLAIKKTIVNANVLNQKLNLEFSSLYEDSQILHFNSELDFTGDTLRFHLDPKKFILNSNSWQVDEGNRISIAKEYLEFKDFRISRNNQEMHLSNDRPGIEKEHLSLEFKNFKLAALLNYLNPEEKLATGQLNGNIVYEEPFGETGILADMQINQLEILGVDLNTLSLNGESSGFSNYDFDLAVKGGEVDLDLKGTYTAADPSAQIDMQLDLNKVEMTALEGFSQGEIKNASGSFSGSFSLNGSLLKPLYEGSINFNSALFNIAMLNASFVLPDEKLSLDNDAVYFNNFNINDTNNNSVVVNGELGTKNLLNPTFDLDVQATDFRLLNSTKKDNELFYGNAVVDVDAQIKGDLNLPEVDMNVDIKESTDFTYVMPQTELQINERDGVVIFVNKENPDAILSQTEEESYVVSGYDIFSRITVNKGATFNIIINEETGDKFQVQGEGDLIFNMYPNGRTALTGIYEINDGFYEMSLYNLVKRRFDIADGSRVSWAGDPFDAQLDVRAIYRVETSASALMASSISGSDLGESQRFRQEIPFLVYLNIKGDLMQPKITFNLDMPEDEQGIAGGQVFGRVQQLNNQEQELNKQVFSLLVLNRFFPESGSDGSQGGTLAVARDNLNSALSDQLNMLSSKILGESGVQLNFNVDSFTDYQGTSPEERTQLGISAQKAFLEDRLVVEVGSEVDIQGGGQEGQEASPVIGNVSISYLLDKDGIWRLKGFSKNQYENVVDGQLVVSGIALIFTREFNKFKNIFEKAVMENVKKEKDKSKKEENNTDEN